MHDIVSLIEDHDAMDALADRLIAAARATEPATLCRATMAELAERLDRHLREEADFLIHDDSSGSLFDREVASFEAAFAEFPGNWQNYLDRWDADAIGARRAAYAGETADLMTVLKLRLASENNVLYPLALQTGRIAYPPEL